MRKVSLAILVHDESAFLEKFLKSTVGYFDEIVAVIDQPAKQLERILKKYQVKYSYKKFLIFPHNAIMRQNWQVMIGYFLLILMKRWMDRSKNLLKI
jgi:cytochrome oxidase Cu insertion factor (SCO1/SenC/PrrC family)